MILGTIRSQGRKVYDSLYCRDLPDKRTLGKVNQWTIRTAGLNKDAVVYSGGVGQDISFELELAERFGCEVFLFDPSPVGSTTVNSLHDHPEIKKIKFSRVGLAGRAGTSTCAIGGQDGGMDWLKTGVGQTITCETISNLVRRNHHSAIDLLKLDIEGFEYEVLEDCLDNGIRIQQICLEFHHFFKDIPLSRTNAMLKRLRKAGFSVFHRNMYDFSLYRTI